MRRNTLRTNGEYEINVPTIFPFLNEKIDTIRNLEFGIRIQTQTPVTLRYRHASASVGEGSNARQKKKARCGTGLSVTRNLVAQAYQPPSYP
jgi:hypothetical protein